MTREEAIQVLSMVEAHGTLVIQAKEMAIKALKQEPCDKCVYSTSEGCQYDDITETIPPFETSDDAISRQAVLKIIDGWYEQNRDTDNIEDLIVLITYMDSVTPQKPICPSAGVDCEDCPAYEPKTGHSFPEGATNKDIFKAIFGYEPATDSVVCNKEDWCGASEPCNYCLNNSNSIGREEDWWNAPYKAEGSKA